MDDFINEYGERKIEELETEPLLLPEYKAKAVEIIRNVLEEYRADYLTQNEAAREIEDAEQNAAKVLRRKKSV